MTKKQLSTPLKFAQLQAVDGEGDEWKISGYATIYDNVNCYGFKIAHGAYSKLIAGGVQPKMFFNHRSLSVPIGKWTKLEEDALGLKVEGVLTKGVSMASDVYHALKAGTLDGLSVSISWDSDHEVEEESGELSVNEIAGLYEISVVNEPADDKARITQTLSADEIDDRIEHIESVRDFEAFLRDAANLSKRQSGWLTSKAKAVIALDKERDVSPEAQELTALFKKINSDLKNL